MRWKSVIVYPAVLLLIIMVAGSVQAKKKTDSDDSTVAMKYLWMHGTVSLIELYELKETLIVYDYDDDVWVEKLVPVAEPDLLYFLTIVGDQSVDGDGDGVIDYELKDGDQWLLDFGPEWYAADPCLITSYICADGGGIQTTGPFLLGDFTCDGETTVSVVSNDPDLEEASIPLLSRTRRDGLPLASSVYALGRSGGSEIVWISDENNDGIFERYDRKVGVNIIWEMDDGDGQAWWRSEAPPQAMTSELSCSVGD